MHWTSRGAVLALSILLVAPAAALAAGGPVPPSQDIAIHVPGGSSGYGAFGAGRATVVKRLGVNDVPTGAQLRVAGHYGIPVAAYNGATTGLSANGRTLVLAQITEVGVPRVTRLLVIDTRHLTIRSRITLPGWATVDAISPDGRWLYLIHYRAADISKYEVLGYDLLRHRMLAKPIVDPDDRGEAMTGFPITRVMSAASRWAYTLYLRPSGAPFVHALDTVAHRAVCVDLPSLAGLDVSNGHLRLGSGGALLRVDVAATTRAVINTRTLALVTHAAAPARPASSSAATRPAVHRSASRNSGGVPWALVAGLLAALFALAAGLAHRARPVRGAPSPR
jgi:hypothetical protein